MDIDRHLLFIFKNVFREFRGVNKSKLIYLFTIIKKKILVKHFFMWPCWVLVVACRISIFLAACGI